MSCFPLPLPPRGPHGENLDWLREHIFRISVIHINVGNCRFILRDSSEVDSCCQRMTLRNNNHSKFQTDHNMLGLAYLFISESNTPYLSLYRALQQLTQQPTFLISPRQSRFGWGSLRWRSNPMMPGWVRTCVWCALNKVRLNQNEMGCVGHLKIKVCGQKWVRLSCRCPEFISSLTPKRLMIAFL